MLGPGGDDARSNSLPAQRLEMDSTRDNSAYSTLHPLYMVNFLIVKSSSIQLVRYMTYWTLLNLILVNWIQTRIAWALPSPLILSHLQPENYLPKPLCKSRIKLLSNQLKPSILICFNILLGSFPSPPDGCCPLKDTDERRRIWRILLRLTRWLCPLTCW